MTQAPECIIKCVTKVASSEAIMRYRQAAYEDWKAIATLHANSWRVHYRGAYSDEYLDGDALQDRMKVWERRLSAPADNQFVVVAEEAGTLIGFACAYGRDDAQWGTLLDNLHVRPEQHRQGAGTGLVTEVARWCRENYADCGLYLWVLAQNVKAQRFYQRLGGTERGREFRLPSAGGGPPCEICRYVWATLSEIA